MIKGGAGAPGRPRIAYPRDRLPLNSIDSNPFDPGSHGRQPGPHPLNIRPVHPSSMLMRIGGEEVGSGPGDWLEVINPAT
ncbi:MAG: hypothetical protein LUQ49_01395, partial [Methanomicrobiales archaeon]|nr:hypothetical protein [Methanomicrobiales archaeon]